MKRKTPTNGFIANWKKATFPHGKDKAIEVEKLPVQNVQQSNGTSLTLIKKEPVAFQLSRFENPNDFELMFFVTRACLKIADRPFKTVLHVEQTRTGSRLVACDGLRLHVAEISKKIKSGNYKPRVNKNVIFLIELAKNIDFPTWSKVIPDNAVKCGVINLEKSSLGKDRKETEKLSVALHTFMKQTGEPINVRYLEDLTKREWVIFSQAGQEAIFLRQKSARIGEPTDKGPMAVIMPIAKSA